MSTTTIPVTICQHRMQVVHHVNGWFHVSGSDVGSECEAGGMLNVHLLGVPASSMASAMTRSQHDGSATCRATHNAHHA